MLKRQRPVSPPPSSHVPFMTSDPIDIGHQSHDAKRRRIIAPVLDGGKRGWGSPIPERCDDEYDDEDELQEELEPNGEQGRTDDGQWRDWYRSTNSFLHELHALHRYRVSNSSTPSSSSSSNQQGQSWQTSPLRSSRQFSPSCYDNTPMKSVLPPISERLRVPSFDQSLTAQKDMNRCDLGDGKIWGEVQRVTERYEDTNRLLGSLVLSRRRELQDAPVEK